jgi:poly(hydroxyalkanoate) granule-associated protein
MVKKLPKLSNTATPEESSASAPLTGVIKDSAQQIWLAGLGAFAKAQQEGGKVFEALVQEGLSVQRKTQVAAEERMADATHRVTGMANDITAKATGQWDKLETIFENRVSRTLNKLGVPTAQDIEALIARIDELNRNVQLLQSKPTPVKSQRAAATDEVADLPLAPEKSLEPKKPTARKKPVSADGVVGVPAKPAVSRSRKAVKPSVDVAAAPTPAAAG